MDQRRRTFLLLLAGAALSGCARARVPVTGPRARTRRPVPRPGGGPAGPAGGRSPEALDTTSRQQRAAALGQASPGAHDRRLGVTIATLGDPTRPGFWLETPLVGAPARGRVVVPSTGASVALELIPIAAEPGAGSRLSLAAMRLLGVALGDLPELIVYAR